MRTVCDRIETVKRHFNIHAREPLLEMAKGFMQDSGPFRNSGFLILSGVYPWLELIGQFHTGETSRNDGGKAFYEGLRQVFGYLTDCQCNRVYTAVRHGLAHDATMRGGVRLDRNRREPLAVSGPAVYINPALVVDHLNSYMERLFSRLWEPQSADDCVLQQNFDSRVTQMEEELLRNGTNDTGGTMEPLNSHNPWYD